MLDERENDAQIDYEAIQEQRTDELTELLDKRDMKSLQRRMEEMNEFDVAEFLTEIDDNKMPMVFRLLSKETAAEVFANFDAPEQERIINSITDSVTKSISQVITSGGPAVISGSNIKILGDDPSVGIYLTKDEEGAVPLKVSVIVHNAPSQLTIMLPAIEAGKLYALSITTQYSGSNKALKTPRSYRFPILLGDENAGGGGGGGEAPDPEIPGGGEAPDPAA